MRYDLQSAASAIQNVGSDVSATTGTNVFVTRSVYYAESSSYAGHSDVASLAINATNADTASLALYARQSTTSGTSSYALSSSIAYHADRSDQSDLATLATNATNAVTSSLAISSSYASFATNTFSSSNATLAQLAILSTNATNATNAVNAQTSSFSISSSTALYAGNTISSSNALFANYAESAGSSSYFITSLSASYATTSSYSVTANNAFNSDNASNAVSSSHSLVSDVSVSSSHSVRSDRSVLADSATTSSYSTYSNSSNSSSYATTANSSNSSSFAVSSSHAIVADVANSLIGSITSASFSTTSSYSISSSHALISDLAKAYNGSVVSSSYAMSASWAPDLTSPTSSWSVTSSMTLVYNGSVVSSSYANTASYVHNPVTESNGALYYGLERLTMGSQRRDPTGFLNRTSTTLVFDDASKKFMITGSNFVIYSAGKEYIKNSEAVSLSSVTPGTLTRIYYDANTLNISTTTDTWDIESANVPIATVYWGGTRGVVGDERHGIQMDGKTQEYLHETMGPRYANGYTLTHTGSNPLFIMSAGEFYDDDNEYNDLSAISQSRIIWHSGSVMVCTPLQSRLWMTSSAGTIAYDNLTTTASVTQFSAYWIYAVNGTNTRFVSVMGQRQDNTINNARNNNLPQNLSFGTFPLDEAKLLYRIIYDASGVVQDTTDYRQSQFGGSNYTATAHGTLSGLANDDHLQYLLLAGRDPGQTIVGPLTASIHGTSSWSTNSVTANTASYISSANLPAHTASWATNAITADTSSYVASTNVVGTVSSASYAISSSHALVSDSALSYNGSVVSSSFSTTASFALNAGGGTSLTLKTITSSYDLVSDDNGKFLSYLSGSNGYVFVDSGLPSNFIVTLHQSGSGKLRISSSLDLVSNNPTGSNGPAAQNAVAYLYRKSDGGLVLWGDTGYTAPPPAPTPTSSWAPTDIANCYSWYHADAITGSNGDVVNEWVDSGSANKTLTPYITEGPQLLTNYLNGHNVLTGSHKRLRNDSWYASYNASQAMTIFCVAKQTVRSGDSNQVFLGNDLAGATHDLHVGNNGSGEMYATVNGAGIFYADSQPFDWSIFTIKWDVEGNTSYMRQDKTDKGNAVMAKTWTGPVLSVLARPYNSDNSQFFGAMAELIIYERLLSGSEITEVEDYLSTKYNI